MGQSRHRPIIRFGVAQIQHNAKDKISKPLAGATLASHLKKCRHDVCDKIDAAAPLSRAAQGWRPNRAKNVCTPAGSVPTNAWRSGGWRISGAISPVRAALARHHMLRVQPVFLVHPVSRAGVDADAVAVECVAPDVAGLAAVVSCANSILRGEPFRCARERRTHA
jgi:hypothetical protein